MQIILSAITWNIAQIDGTSNVRETHIDDQGNEYVFDYEALSGFDVNARLMARAAEITNGSAA